MTGPDTEGTDFGLAGLEPATADDGANAAALFASGLAFAQEHEHGLAASNYLGTGAQQVLAARVTRDQEAGTYTVRLHRAGDAWEGLAWLKARAAEQLDPAADRRAAALARSARTVPPPRSAMPRTAAEQPRAPVRRR
ncbi:hypothetical protein ACFVUH_08295 [Kitasatospora sp. NPDC058032]|uniref:hypothetical protein n=1 Tax=Kitasatospora sp. NPDC058032 TaxID=3346307 RepID=UPI0036D7A54A